MAVSKEGKGSHLLFVIVGLIVVVAIGYVVFNFIVPMYKAPSAANNVYLSLTDPATVPAGTTALFITYSDIQLVVSTGGVLSTVSLPGGTGTANVLDLQNAYVVIGAMHVRNGSKIVQIRVNITSAVITVNGVNSTVVIGEGTIKANVSSGNNVTGTTNAVVDLVPSVTSIQTVDKTIYVLTPSVRAVVTPNNVFVGQSANVSKTRFTPPPIGVKINFTGNTNLSNIFKSVTPTIKITSASIAVSGNDTSFSMTVENTGNSSVELNGLMINGLKKVYFPAPPVSLMFRMPAMVFPMPMSPPSGVPLPSNFVPPPKFVITFPNRTVMNTSGSYEVSSQPPHLTNGTMPPPNGSSLVTGTFYLLDIVHPAFALSVNSTGALINLSGDIVWRTSSPPMMSFQPNSSQQSGPVNITVPAGAVSTPLPLGTTLYVQFPPGMAPPKQPTPPIAQAQQMPIGRMILLNGTLGFPPMSLISKVKFNSASTQGTLGNETSSINSGASNLIANGASNLTLQIPAGAIPPGYELAAGASFTFTLNGLLLLGPAPSMPMNVSGGPNNMAFQPPFAILIPGDTYSIDLFGASGTHASTQVVAS